EDVDSLRFALSLKDYNLNLYQPHFPGYFVFSMLGQLFYLFTGSLAFSFSLIGALSVFIIVFCTNKIADLSRINVHHGVLCALLFFCPLIWLMSNRYMADLLGLAFLLVSFKIFLKAFEKGDGRWLWGYYLALGLLAGIRLSYVPFLLIPSLVLCFKYYTKLVEQILASIVGVGIWLVPMIIDTGWQNLIELGSNGTDGHFNEWGGTIGTDPNYSLRFIRMFQYIWADGLGNFWPDRHPITLLSTLGFGTALFVALLKSKPSKELAAKLKSREAILMYSLLTYAIWAFLFQNVLYKSRHILPFLPFILIWAAKGFKELVIWNKKLAYGLIGIFFVSYIFTTGVLVSQHRSPTAISQAKDFILEKQSQADIGLVGVPLVNFFINRQLEGKIKYFSEEGDLIEVKNILEQGYKVYSFSQIDIEMGRPYQKVYTFFHNPYVNRMWSEVKVYEYEQ
ncbi:hypothetical protein, partial [Xanthovirga aplysinae]|uniref:hypothetical protein n=1 Tax=Xanthovirga aplysinae TaxID=2529853 RepID=UPI0016571B5A